MLQALNQMKPVLSNITIPGEGIPVEIFAILDPLSKTAQRMAPVLDFLQKTLQLSLKVSHLLPHRSTCACRPRAPQKCLRPSTACDMEMRRCGGAQEAHDCACPLSVH